MSSSFPQSPLAQTTGDADSQASLPGLRASHANGHHADTRPVHPVHAEPAPDAPAAGQQTMDMTEWDMMFDAVRSRLKHTVGQRLGELPDTPQHSAALSASLVQAVVLDCITELDKLHAALKRDRRQRPTD